MKKVTLKSLDAYRLSAEEKRSLKGGGWGDGPCLDCAIGWVKIVDHCQYVQCKSCNDFPANYPGCEVEVEEPIDCCTERVDG